MPNLMELEQFYRDRLFELLVLEKNNVGITINGLDLVIAKAKAPMTEESIAWVEKLVNSIP